MTTESLPHKATANPYALHGTQGRLIVRLQRFSMLGWALFVLLLIGVMALVAVSTLAPKPVVAVDAAGRVLGTLEYLSPSARTDQEVQATAAYVAQSCLSLNADTIADDLAECMNMMAEPLYNQWIELLKTGYVSRIREAGARSTVVIPSDGITMVGRKGLTATVQVHGTLTLNSLTDGRASTDEKPFALELTLTAIPRSTISTRGFRLDGYKDI